MKNLWSPSVRELTPYVPGEQPKVANLVKLNTNENPFAPSPAVLAAISAANGPDMRLYPDPEGAVLKQAIANYYQVDAPQVFVGNGSDEVLAHAFCAFFKQDLPILRPDISYGFYPAFCGLYGIDSTSVPLDQAMRINVDDYRAACGGVVIANPNAPTGIALSLAEVEQIVQSQPERVVLIDEAYVDFGGDSAVGLVQKYPNLLVVQTMSKSRSLAGLRVGFAIGHSSLIDALERVKHSFNSYPLDRLALAGGVAAIEDDAYFQDKRQRLMQMRERLTGQLRTLGFEVLPSATNFVFARHPQHDGATLAAALRARSVLVRHFAKPRIDQFLRISIGADAECDALVAALTAILAQA
jgi:histidinol-phosphate aminotransferase